MRQHYITYLPVCQDNVVNLLIGQCLNSALAGR
nr:MAG TPA_asm: hypothetical protein [Caudoviricetes sp.]